MAIPLSAISAQQSHDLQSSSTSYGSKTEYAASSPLTSQLQYHINAYREVFSCAKNSQTTQFAQEMIQMVDEASESSFRRYLTNLNENRTEVNDKIIGRITNIFVLLKTTNNATGATLDNLDALFGILQCTFRIGHNLCQGSRDVAEKLESMATWTEELANKDLEVIPIWTAWDILAQLSICIVRFCRQVAQSVSVAEVRNISTPHLDLKLLCQDFERHAMTSRNQFAKQEIEKNVRQIQEQKASAKRDEEIKVLHTWLESYCNDAGADRHATIAKSRQPGTCGWFIEEVTSWFVEGQYQVFWAEGKPGVGKSVLVSAVVDKMLNNISRTTSQGQNTSSTGNVSHMVISNNDADPAATLAYIYFAYDEQDKQRPLSIYAQLVSQLFTVVPSLERDLCTLRDDAEKSKRRVGDQEPEDLVRRRLLKILQKLSRSIILVFDALDEASSDMRQELRGWIKDMDNEGPRLLISTRTDVQKPCKVSEIAKCKYIEAGDQDMDEFVAAQLKASEHLSRIVRRTLRDDMKIEKWIQERRRDILSNARKIFILAVFRVRDVCSQRTVADMKDAACKRDTNPGAIYTRTWDQITAVSPYNATLARRIIGWLTFAKSSMNADELTEALSIRNGIYCIDRSNRMYGEDMEEICRGLVIFDNREDPSRVRLAHQTVQEHFFTLPKFQGMKEEICIACFTYIISISTQSLDEVQSVEESSEDDSILSETSSITALESLKELNLSDDEPRILNYETELLGFSYDSTSQDEESEWSYDEIIGKTAHDWPNNLMDWVSSDRILSSYAGRFAIAHLRDITSNEELNGVLTEFMTRMFAARRQSIFTDDADPSTLYPYGMNILHLATFLGVREVVSGALLLPNAAINSRDALGRTPISWAAYFGLESIVEILLDEEAEVNTVDIHGDSAICYASNVTNKGILRRLVEMTDPVQLSSKALHRAVEKNNFTLVQLLLQRQVDPNYDQFGERRTALHEALLYGHSQLVPLLLKERAQVSVRDAGGQTPLIYAARYNRLADATLLLTCDGVNPNDHDDKKRTALHYASQHSEILVRRLIRKNAIPTAQDIDGRSVLIWAIDNNWTKAVSEKGQLEIIHQLASDKEVILHSAKNGSTALHYAAKWLELTGIRALLNTTNGVGLDVLNNSGKTPLLITLERRNTYLVNWMLDAYSINLDTTFTECYTYLHYAVQYCEPSTVAKLIQLRPSLKDQQSMYGKAPMITAILYDKLESFMCLVANGADINARYLRGDTVFFEACINGRYLMLDLLIDQWGWLARNDSGIWVPYCNTANQTALHSAMSSRSLKTVTRVLALPYMSILDQDASGKTALHLAVIQSSGEIVKELLKEPDAKKAVNILTYAGKSALDFALERDDPVIIEVLVRFDARFGLIWAEDLETVQKWARAPWFPALRQTIGIAATSSCQNRVIDPKWIVLRARGKTSVQVSCDEPDEPYVSLKVKHDVRFSVRRIIFTTLSHDQGWSNNAATYRGSYNQSYTWFEAGILRSGGDTPVLRQVIQVNMHADSKFRLHTNIWDFRDATPGLRDFLETIENGDTVQVFAIAKYSGWVNYVKEVGIELYSECSSPTDQEKTTATSAIPRT